MDIRTIISANQLPVQRSSRRATRGHELFIQVMCRTLYNDTDDMIVFINKVIKHTISCLSQMNTVDSTSHSLRTEGDKNCTKSHDKLTLAYLHSNTYEYMEMTVYR